MIVRVFCYSKEEADKNGNKLPILQLILAGIGIIIVPLVFGIIMSSDSFDLFILFLLISIGVLIYFSVILGLRLNTRMTGFALDSNGKLYRAMIINNGQGLYCTGFAAGNSLDYVFSGGKSNIGGTVDGALYGIAQISAMNRSAKLMSYPEIVAQMVEQAQTVTGGIVYAIERVHSFTETKHSIKIICDYTVLKTGKTKQQKKLKVEKSYNYFDELKNHIFYYPGSN